MKSFSNIPELLGRLHTERQLLHALFPDFITQKIE